jgi:hypothetical protein
MVNIIELGIGFLGIGVASYAIYRYRVEKKWARVRREQAKRLRWLKRKIEREV